MSSDLIQRLLIMLPPLMLAISVHEAAHGYMAYRKGDYTAKMLGRVSLNPIKHIDPVGTILVPLMLAISSAGVIFGWAKPVPVNSFNFKSPRKDNMLVSFAGPASNLLLAMALALIFRILVAFPGADAMMSSPALKPLFMMIYFGIRISVILFVFNLIPIFPLDGSHIVEGLLPAHLAQVYSRHERYGFLILIGLMVTGVLFVIINPIYKASLFLITGILGIGPFFGF